LVFGLRKQNGVKPVGRILWKIFQHTTCQAIGTGYFIVLRYTGD